MQTSDRKSDKCKIRSFQVDGNVFRCATKISFMDKKNIGTVDGTVCFVCLLFIYGVTGPIRHQKIQLQS